MRKTQGTFLQNDQYIQRGVYVNHKLKGQCGQNIWVKGKHVSDEVARMSRD